MMNWQTRLSKSNFLCTSVLSSAVSSQRFQFLSSELTFYFSTKKALSSPHQILFLKPAFHQLRLPTRDMVSIQASVRNSPFASFHADFIGDCPRPPRLPNI